MIILEVIPAKRYRNIIDGRTCSIYGAVPWYSDSDKANWKIEQYGYTWRTDQGTIGLGRVPASTYNDALEIMNRINKRKL